MQRYKLFCNFFLLIFCLPFACSGQIFKLDSLERELNHSVNDSIKLETLSKLAESCEIKDILKYTWPTIVLAKKTISKNKIDKNINNFISQKLADAYNNTAVFYDNTGVPDSAKYYYNLSLKTHQLIKNKEGEAAALNNLGFMYETLGNNALALKYHLESLNLREELHDTANMAVSLNNIGLIYQKQGHINQSTKYYLKSYGYAKKAHHEGILFAILNNLGSAYSDVKDFTAALKYHNLAYDVVKNTKSKHSIAQALQNIATIHLDQKQYPKALDLYKKCHNIQKEINDKRGESYSLILMATILKQFGEKDSAEKLLKEALQISIEISSKHNQCDAYYKLAEINYDNNDLKTAQDNCTKSLLIAQDLNYPISIYKPANLLRKIYIKTKQFEKALEMTTLYENAKDSIYSQEGRKATIKSQLEMEFLKRESELKSIQQNQIEKLASENQIRIAKSQRNYAFLFVAFVLVFLIVLIYILFQRSKQKRIELEMEKNKALYRLQALVTQMNPHFIFNAINSIQNYILQNNTQYAYNYLASFSKLIRQVLINSQSNYTTLKRELDLVETYLDLEKRRYKNRFDYQINSSEILDIESIQVPVLILQPFVENAIWHGIMNLPEDILGFVRIDLKEDEKNITITITDNGVGRKKSTELKSESAHQSFGIMITEQRLKVMEELTNNQIKFAITDSVRSSDNPGTKVEITFPSNININDIKL